jgi:arsenate reductase (glutaredoxin)
MYRRCLGRIDERVRRRKSRFGELSFGGDVTATLYGIKNCDTMKKARAWFDQNGVAYDFHDYKSAGIDRARLEGWCDALGYEALLNRNGTTFRKLADAHKNDLDATRAIALMLAQPSMIRRPVLDLGDGRLLVGFNPQVYADALKRAK